jgi:glutathione synthase/RimK-type ligase-like ATP-grasp enzyme
VNEIQDRLIMKKQLVGIMREKKYSPNHINNDALIIKMTAYQLELNGYAVTLMTEGGFGQSKRNFDGYFSMGRSRKTLDKLEELEAQGLVVVNSAKGVNNSCMENLFDLFQKNSIPVPRSVVVDNDKFDIKSDKDFSFGKSWVKRENHSLHREDVTAVYSLPEMEDTIKEFRQRGITKSVIQEHMAGSEIKFYGVREMDYFTWYYVNGETHNKFDEIQLKSLAEKASIITDLYIYGGDAIISDKGEISFIDFNDWPSFAPVRETASRQIAELINQKIRESK